MPIPVRLPTAGSAELQIFRVVALLRESLWSTIQTVASDIEFDYTRYAATISSATVPRGLLLSKISNPARRLLLAGRRSIRERAGRISS